jgi:hypothetical protein
VEVDEVGDPWLAAWNQLKAFVATGATKEAVTEYATELRRGLPEVRDPVAYAQQAAAVQQVVTEILGPSYPRSAL